MKIALQDYFEDLKKQVLALAEIKTITPADCYHLSLKIHNKTQKRISETTLKRVYGFATTHYKSSIYTRNALAEYCDFESYNLFVSSKEVEGLESSENKSWAVILENAHKISRFSIESNKHRSGIRYSSTIYRQQLDQLIQQFTESKAAACIIQAPAGGGKTIGLTKWVDRQINQKPWSNNKDICLFIQTSNLLSSSIFSFHGTHWLGYLLGLEKGEHLYNFINTYKDSSPGNFYLVIDDMTNNYISTKQYHTIFSQLIEMANFFHSFSWFKIILSIRPHIWNKNKHLIEGNKNICLQWMTDTTHLNGFSQEEIQELAFNLTNQKNKLDTVHNEQLDIISLPLHFQLLYQLKGKKLQPNNINSSDQYIILGSYLNNHILKGNYINEIALVLDRISRYVFYKEGTLCIERYRTISIFKEFPEVYKELTNSGVLHSYINTVGSRAVSLIKFQSSTLGTYFLAQRILQKNKKSYYHGSIEFINRSHYPNSIKIELLKWLIIFAIESSHFELLNYLSTANFIKDKELEIIIFTINSKESLLNVDEHKVFNEKTCNPLFIDFALLHISIFPENQTIYESILKYNLNPHHQVLVHSAIALIAFSCLKVEVMYHHIEELKTLQQTNAFKRFYINPLNQIEALYNYFKYGEISKVALQEITEYIFHNYRHSDQVTHPITLSSAFLASNLSRSPMKPLRLLNAIQKHEILNNMPVSNEYSDFIQLMKAQEWIKNDRLDKATSIQFICPGTLETKPAIQILYSIYKINLAYAKHECILALVDEAIQVAQKHNYLLSEVVIRVYSIDILKRHDDARPFIQEFENALKPIFEKTGFRRESFLEMVKKDYSLPIELSK